ncbi:MAG: MFS transporter [Verrucomicrobiota bacterium]
MSERAPSQTRTIVAGSVGNVMEWFDFAVYGFFAQVIGNQFFPAQDPVTSLLAAFGVFASGFLARPLGAAFFGHLGDRFGRAVVLRWSVILMGASTCLLGLLPTYEQIGMAAPILIVVLRIAQGFSVGGEYTGSVIYLVERAPAGRRGIVGAWTNFGAVAGFLLGSAMAALIAAVLSDEQVASWGWRVPFVLGVSIAGLAAFFRRGLKEAADHQEPDLPLKKAFQTEWRTMLRIAGVIMMANVGFYMMFVYVTTYLSEEFGVPMALALEIDTAAMAALLVFTPLGGWLSDRLGRKPVTLFASIGCFLLAIPLLMAVGDDDPMWIFLGQLGFAVFIGFSGGANAALLVEITKAPYRCTVISVAYNTTLAIFGGTTPVVATWLISNTGDVLTPAYYIMVMAVITTLTLAFLPETSRRELDRSNLVES